MATAEDGRRLFAEYVGFVYRMLRSLGAPAADAEDLTQEAFMVAIRKRGEIEPGHERAYLYAVARRVLMHHRRGRTRALAREQAARLPQRDHDPERAAIERDELSVVRHALDDLPEEQRVVFCLVDVEGMSGPEVAMMTETKLNTVYTRLAAARKVVRSRLAASRKLERTG